MPDIVDKVTRSRMMSGIRGAHTLPELTVRRYLHSQGFRYRLHGKRLPGKPDIVLPKYSVVVFVHGCFWHRHEGCRFATTPSTNRKFWLDKFADNVSRDMRNQDELIRQGWRVFVVWECRLTERTLISLVRQIKKTPRKTSK